MNLGTFFAGALSATPDRTAIIDAGQSPVDRLSYAELDARMCRIARVLHDDGIRRGDRVLVLTGNRCLFVEAFFAIMRIGAVPVPLNVAMAEATLDHVLSDSGARAAVISDAIRPQLLASLQAHAPVTIYGEATASAGSGTPAGVIDLRARMTAFGTDPAGPPVAQMQADDTAIHTYTSGSTGVPKGVILTHGGMLWSLEHAQRHLPVSPTARGLIALPMFHKNAMRGIVKPMLYAGASIVILPTLDAESFFAAIHDYKCTYTSGVPAAFNILHAERQRAEGRDLSSLSMIAVGSATVSPEMVDRLTRIFPNAAIKESYGLTEGGSPFWPHPDGLPTPGGSCGYLAPGYQVKLIDPSTGAEGDIGELWMKSPYVAREYHNLPDLTRERLPDGWLKTGDLFARDEAGFYYFRGRTDDMFNCGGENVYPKEVEDLLLGHPAVAEAVVMPMHHATKGAAPAALVRLAPGETGQGQSVTADELRAFCLENAPAYLHPRYIAFCRDLPLNPAGKYDRAAIKRLLEADGAVRIL
ncbi:class I adenylate-forming enzyme family protein [Fodinicurvata sp. EGI_FJ10296]|uniref:class I adenylate-forming enzyme family protein n=1 Tax=Fodinicurvata sp. EGI_FJ10296 TaxID=3231908 RepID=UPI0034541A36